MFTLALNLYVWYKLVRGSPSTEKGYNLFNLNVAPNLFKHKRMYFPCRYDFITTTDSSGRIIQRLSGSGAVHNMKVGGNTTQLINIVFTSDNVLPDYGFLAQYSITIGE